MPRYLLDTNIAIFLVKGLSASALHRANAVGSESFAISVVTEAELLFGIALKPHATRMNLGVEKFLAGTRILPWDSRCAATFGQVAARQQSAGLRLDGLDAMIAAHALAYDLVLVSNDHVFEQVDGLHLEDWTKGPQRA